MSGGDYAHAQWLPSPNFWAGGDGNWYVVIHATASGGPQTGYQLATSKEFTDGQSKSVHYINDVDGTVYQIVREADSAWGNCCVDGNSPFDPKYNWNHKTISIENVKHSSDNAEPLTPAQYQSLLALVRDICTRQGIPMQQGTPTTKGILYHHNLMPIQKARCPGTFPYDTFFQDLSQGGTSMLLQLDKDGCVVTVAKSFQLEENESEDLCGPWAAYATAMAVQAGSATLTDAEKIDQFTDQMVDDYGTAHGNAFNHINWPGSLDSDMIWFLNYVRDHTNRIHYQVIPATINNVRTAIQAGYPVLFSCNELDIIEERTGQVPYPWRLSAMHIMPATGVNKNGDLICPDQLNNSYQGYWPVVYRAANIAHSLSWACIIKLPFLAAIPTDNPLSWPQGFNAQNFGGNVHMNWPSLGMQQQAQDTWLISAKFLQAAFGGTAPYTTGIALAWQDAYKRGKNYGPPVCTEQNSVDWNNKPVKVQLFAAGVRAEWDGACHWFDKDGPLN